MKKINLLFVLTLLLFQGMAQDYRLQLWPEGAPNQNTSPGEERFYVDNGTGRYDNISEAELFVYLPEMEKNTGAAVVICPGGGYRVEAIEHEGFQIAEFLKENGIAGIVLKYRLPYGNPEIPLTDALQAIRFVRSKSDEWGIDPQKVGIAGSSAGGHLASTAGTHYDLGDLQSNDPLARLSSRPDFMLLLYPVISFDEKIGHMGSRINLIGETNDWKLASKYSNELHVNEQTPPTFFVLADDDRGVVPENSIRFYLAMKQFGVPAELHIFSHGGHGFGMKKINKPAEQWPGLFVQWMKAMTFTE
ncbi:alpha/beta hydrolase [Gaoshiqia sediminis]|uniref:Alpha/beta hydrolase n=1 Tax=Gaoshiqia sediminis TaxID=2986998 RepID=A0AA41Y9Y3_9BACT|nr:alpha/beta hydrolase [Gaoshiqia sediminis]MCW0484680.1 alpha/beta hydrolase [Gaoshiqia sediminis]